MSKRTIFICPSTADQRWSLIAVEDDIAFEPRYHADKETALAQVPIEALAMEWPEKSYTVTIEDPVFRAKTEIQDLLTRCDPQSKDKSNV